MSRLASRFLSHRVLAVAAFVPMLVPLARAQTIADYSHAQRLALESAMAQAAARSAGLAAPVPAVAASAAISPATAPARAMPAQSVPDVQVSGVFASSGGALAEVRVNATPYLLEPGERVPGTTWEVRAVTIDRVVLARPGSELAHDAGGGLRVFALPALR